jgi:hypothetical protein
MPLRCVTGVALRLVSLLLKRGDRVGAEQVLRARAEAGDGRAAWSLNGLLAERGDLDGLRARAEAGDGNAGGRLAHLLAERGDLDELRTRADSGDWSASQQLADLLMRQSGEEEGERLRRFGLNPDGSIARP